MVKRTREEVLDAIKGSLGIMSTIAKRLGCESRTAKRLIEQWKDTQEALADESERVLDLAESSLYDALIKKEQWATKFVLSTKGRTRCYEQTPIIKLDGTDPLNINLTGDMQTAQDLINSATVEIPDYEAEPDTNQE